MDENLFDQNDEWYIDNWDELWDDNSSTYNTLSTDDFSFDNDNYNYDYDISDDDILSDMSNYNMTNNSNTIDFSFLNDLNTDSVYYGTYNEGSNQTQNFLTLSDVLPTTNTPRNKQPNQFATLGSFNYNPESFVSPTISSGLRTQNTLSSLMSGYNNSLTNYKSRLKNLANGYNSQFNKQISQLDQIKQQQNDILNKQLELSQQQFSLAKEQWNETKQELDHIRAVRQHITQKYFS